MPSASSAKRVAILCHPTLGGSSVVASDLARRLAARGKDVCLFARHRPARLPSKCEGLTFVPCRAPDYPLFESPPHDLALAARLIEEHARRPFDVVHAHYAIPHASTAVFARQMMPADTRPAIVATLHGTDVFLAQTEPAFAPVVRWTLGEVDAITAVSAHLAQEAQAFLADPAADPSDDFRDGPHEIEVIHNAVDPRTYAHLTPKPGPPRLVHVSNFRAVKNAPLVVDIFRAVLDGIDDFDAIKANDDVDDISDIGAFNPPGPEDSPATAPHGDELRPHDAASLAGLELWMIGDGPERAAAEARAAALGLGDRVRFLGATPTPEAWVAGALALVLPSTREAFGLAALEAMAMGVVPVVARTGGLAEVVEDGVSGWCVEAPPGCPWADSAKIAAFASRLREVCVDVPARRRMAEAAQARAASNFTPETLLDRYEAVHRRAMQARGARRSAR